jgi:hypothetical protein
MMQLLKENPEDINLLKEIDTTLQILTGFSVELNVWKSQNILFYIAKENLYLQDYMKRSEELDERSQNWLIYFRDIEKHLQIRISPETLEKFPSQDGNGNLGNLKESKSVATIK